MDVDSTRPDEAAPEGDVNCYLACFPARPIRLNKDRPTTIGRADGNTIVLADTDVSRRHAQIEWIDGRFVIRDLESRNGIIVNDENVAKAPLSPDDRIRIGSRVFTFLVGDEQAVRRLFMRKRKEKLSGATDVIDVSAVVRPMSGFAGNLADFGLGELLQALELGRKTGRVVVNCDGGRGEILVRDGRVIRARVGDLANEDAVYRLLGLDSGRFEFENCPVDIAPEILTKTASLLMEGFRRMDEAQRVESGAPELKPGQDAGEPEAVPPVAADATDAANAAGGSAAGPSTSGTADQGTPGSAGEPELPPPSN